MWGGFKSTTENENAEQAYTKQKSTCGDTKILKLFSKIFKVKTGKYGRLCNACRK